jgi:phosphatidylserine decarboxylase
MITRYGLDTALALIAVSLILVAGAFFFSHLAVRIPLAAIGLFLLAFTLNFFRDPERTTPRVPRGVISPADGKIVQICRVREEEFLHGEAVQVSIFMSPLNVHVNRIPLDGEVAFFRYIKGEYLVAFDDKSSTRNERTLIGIDNGSFKVLFKQIAGFIARRIVCPINVGEKVKAGERFGMIKFGSRVDVLMPPETDIRVAINDAVTAGETLLGVVPEKSKTP